MVEMEIKYEAPASIAVYLSTQLNSLANGGTVLGAKVDNVANGENEMYLGLQLLVKAQPTVRLPQAKVGIYLLPCLDGTNFSYGDSDGLVNPNNKFVDIELDGGSLAERRTIIGKLDIPPFDFKLLVHNLTGADFADSANTLSYRLYSEESQ